MGEKILNYWVLIAKQIAKILQKETKFFINVLNKEYIGTKVLILLLLHGKISKKSLWMALIV